MKTKYIKLVVVSNPVEHRSEKITFNKKENAILDSFKVKSATTAALTAWKGIKKDSLAFAAKLSKVRNVMVKGNSPKSLFSKWLKSVGIPRATAYWYLSGGGKKTNKKQVPVIKQLVKEGTKLEQAVAEQKEELKGTKGEARLEIKQSLQSAEDRLKEVNKRLGNKSDALEEKIKDAFTSLNSVIQQVALLPVEKREPFTKLINSEAMKLGFLSIMSKTKEVKASDFKNSTLAKVFPAHNFPQAVN